MQPFIRIGDKTSHGGVVVGGDNTSTSMGLPIARVGDLVTCPKCGRTTVIATGDSTMIVMGQPVARHGDKTACGATLIASQSFTFVDSGSGQGTSAGTTPRMVSGAVAETTVAVQNEPTHSLGFTLTDEATGVPLARQPIRLVVDGKRTESTTDEEGHVEFVYTGSQPKQVECHVLGIDELFQEEGEVHG